MSAPSASIIAANVPSEPLILTKVSATQTSITLGWNPPLEPNGSPVTSYNVYMDNKLAKSNVVGIVWTQTDSIVTGFLHKFTVTANNGRGESEQSQPISIYAATISTPPVNPRRKSATSSSVTLEWEAPASDGGTPILDYELWWDLGA
jgi:hypothetical protein